MRRYRLHLLVLSLGAVVFWTGFQSARDDDFYSMRKNFELFGSVYEQVVGSYRVRVDPERFMRTGMDAMLETLDPWTDFLDEADNVAMQLRSQPGLGDVRVNLGRRGGRITVLTPDANIGAYRQGARTGDVLLTVEDQPADSLSPVQVRELLIGEPGTTVPVKVERAGEVIDFNWKREAPVVRYVSFAERVPGTNVAMVRMDAFGPRVTREIDNALEDIEESGGPIEGVILDLRDNPGGLVNEAISLVGLFVPNGTPVVSTRGRSPESNRLYETDDEPDWGDQNLVLLMNESSASASEIVSGALQDLDRALVVGEPSFGKGLVQVVRGLPYNTAIKLTYSRYFTPSGRGIRKDALELGGAPIQEFRTAAGRTVREGNGIEPDVAITSSEAGELEEALEREAAFFRYAGVLSESRGQELLAAARASGGITLPDDVTGSFKEWLNQAGFRYTSDIDKQIEALETAIGDGGDASARALDVLRGASAERSDRAFEEASDRIRERLQEELAGRLLDPAERMRMSLRSDRYVLEAVDLLGSGRYESLLSSRR